MKRSISPTHLRPFLSALFLTIGIGFFALGCTPIRMSVPPQLQDQGISLPVERSLWRGALVKEDMNFGDYQVHHVERDWTDKQGINTWIGGQVEATQRYRFHLQQNNAQSLEGRCFVSGKKTSIRPLAALRISSQQEALLCAFQQPRETASRWKLNIRTEGDIAAQGWLEIEDTRIRIQANHSIAGSSFPLAQPSGYVFRLEGQVIAAVEILGKGTIWLSKNLPASYREPIATASAALLLHQNLFSR